MTIEHLKKYRCFVRDWVAVRKAKGLPHDDAARYDLHRRAIGRPCSSTEFTQKEFTKVLRVLKRESAPADFDAQMKLQDADDLRRAAVMRRINAALDAFVPADATAEHRASYLDAIARQMNGGRVVAELTDGEKSRLMGELEQRASAKRAKDNPF